MDIRWENILVSHLKVIPEYRDAILIDGDGYCM